MTRADFTRTSVTDPSATLEYNSKPTKFLLSVAKEVFTSKTVYEECLQSYKNLHGIHYVISIHGSNTTLVGACTEVQLNARNQFSVLY